jgi:oligopeptide transport system substrate-binding protein
LQSYKAGSLDVLTGIEAGQSLVGHPSGLRRVPGLALDYLAFNTSRLPFHRLNARRAFSALWSPTMAASAMGNSAFPAHGIPPSAFGLPAERWQPARSPSSYLSAARFPHGRGLPPITMVLPRDPHLLALARDLRQVWKTRLGVTVTMRQLNASNYGKVLSAHAFDLALVAWGGDYPDPQDFLGTQLGSTADNITGWTRKAYDRSVALADTYNPRDPRRLSLLQQAAQLATRGLPILPLDEPSQTAIIRPDLIGIDLTPLGTIAGDWAHVHTKG